MVGIKENDIFICLLIYSIISYVNSNKTISKQERSCQVFTSGYTDWAMTQIGPPLCFCRRLDYQVSFIASYHTSNEP